MAPTTTFQKNLMMLQSSMLSFAYKLTANRDDAYDLLQDAMLKALSNEDKYTADTNLKGWVFTIMRNIFINNYRRVARTATTVDTTDNQFYINSCQEFCIESPEGAFGAMEISSSIQNLPDEFRIPFTMHVTGYKYQEISDHLDLPVGTVKSRIFTARKRLQEQFADYR